MNQFLPDWNFEGDLPITNQKKPIGGDHELVELLWQNGQVVMHSQTNRKPEEGRQYLQKHDQEDHQPEEASRSYDNSSTLIQDGETISWIHYPLEDSFEKDFCSDFFFQFSPSDHIEVDKPIKHFGSSGTTTHVISSPHDTTTTNDKQTSGANFPYPMPPPRFPLPDTVQKNRSPSRIPSPPIKGDMGSSSAKYRAKDSRELRRGEVRECSFVTVGSSHCGSNQVVNDLEVDRVRNTVVETVADLSDDDARKMTGRKSERSKSETLEQTLTSSSGGSGSSFGRTFRQSGGVDSRKRKSGRDAEESECQSETAELESGDGNKPTSQRARSFRRTRAAEVHNLSERRRRDRINEKMKILKELIPHCNKTDKASMLDEAIEYLKALQLQLQVMWMGGGMAPMMFPGAQHYVPQMGMGMAMGSPPSFPSLHLPRVPVVEHPISMPQNSFNALSYQNSMQNPGFAEQYACLMGFHPLQTASQAMNMFRLGTPTGQHYRTLGTTGTATGPLSGGSGSEDAVSGKLGR